MRGTVGGVIIYEVNGQVRVRAKPAGYTKPKNSKKQEAQKKRFRHAVDFCYKLDDALWTVWKLAGKGTTRSGYNLFIGANVGNFTETGEVADVGKLVVSQGKVPMAEKVEAELTAEGRVRVHWEDTEKVEEDFLQRLQVAVYDPSQPKSHDEYAVYWLEGAGAKRSAGVCEFELPEERGEVVHVYVFFKDIHQGEYSESRYVGTFGKEGV